LNCAEAFAAALFICGERTAAERLMSKFSWGEQFIKLNEDILCKYAQCTNGEQVIAVQNEHLITIERESIENRQREIDLPPMSDSDDEI